AIFTPARPAHQVEVAPFCMDVTEVTVDAYRACSKTGTCKRAFRDSYWTRGKSMTKAEWEKSREAHSPLCNENVDDRGAHPINCVTWEQARFYCESVGKRLPTEAEWEYAARGSDQRTFPWGDEEPTARHLNACGPECIEWRVNAGIDPGKTLYVENDGHPATAPVGSFPAGKTQAGLLDMIGNVFEWTADPFAPYPGSETATPEGENRVIRGGAFNSTEIEFTNPALRYAASVDTHSHGIGFRCATEPKPAAG
ncbi:MAG TPA: SUMF1/EgtB/PvdO family nonheme iron enzyme, partial [Nannocystaceae bacterium]|nr:SUMF1/EgtB/PvdO family nonheme iron enzyme [Nannocystaceae bacterium]